MPTLRFLLVLSLVCAAARAADKPIRVEIPNAAQPQLAVAADGRVWLAYGQLAEAPPPAASASTPDHGGHAAHGGGNAPKKKGHQPPRRAGKILVTSSNDGGATFGPAVPVAQLDKLMLGNRRGPRIAAHGNRVTVTAIADELVAFSSEDGGRTWSEPVTINTVPTSAREGLHDLAGAADGTLFVTWLDLRNGKMELWGAISRDGGRTWGANEPVYRSPDKSICECCHPSALFDREGNLAVMWRNSIEGSRDMWLTTRAKGAPRFSPARKLGDGTWKLNACPMDGGRIVALGTGRFGAVWQRAGEVFFSGPDGAEIALGKGKQPVAVATGRSEPFVVWQQGTGLVAQRGLKAPAPTPHASDARFASAVTVGDDKRVVLAYEHGSQAPSSVVIERL